MPTAPHGRLDGWKAIADHLRRDERTAQRWAKARGMPVHRVPGRRGSAVFALRDEIDAWLLTAGDPPDGADPGPAVTSPSPPVRRGLRLRWALGLGALVVAAATSLAAILARRPGGPVDRIDVEANTLVARAVTGEVLWRHPLAPPVSSGTTVTPRWSPRPWAVDIDGDGQNDLLTAVTFSVGTRSVGGVVGGDTFVGQQLLALAGDGEEFWSFRPERVLTFAGRRFDGPWRLGGWVMPAAAGTRRVWLAFIHHTWWPSFIVAVDANGGQDLRFVGSGHIYAFATLPRDAGTTFVLAGGVNNEFEAASLAVLAPDGRPSTSPQTSASPYWCDGCAARGPLRYILFPRTEVNRVSGDPYNSIQEIVVADGYVEVSAHEADGARAVYRLSRTLDVESVSMSDAYWAKHDLLARAGRLTHTAAECPERREGVIARTWTPADGWRTATVRYAIP